MLNKVVHLNRIGTVTFSKNRRSKNIKISVKPDKTVLVSFPFFVSSKKVVAFLMKNEDWIRKQQQKFVSKKNKIKEGTYLKTKLHDVFFLKGETNKLVKNGLVVKIFSSDFNSEETEIFIDKAIVAIYRFEAKKILPQKLEVLALLNGFSYNKVTIRNNKRNWGSCSFKNNISLNLQMMKLPDELIDYILLHELVHTEIKNHGPGFWEKLNEITNSKARELAKQAKQYSTYTL